VRVHDYVFFALSKAVLYIVALNNVVSL